MYVLNSGFRVDHQHPGSRIAFVLCSDERRRQFSLTSAPSWVGRRVKGKQRFALCKAVLNTVSYALEVINVTFCKPDPQAFAPQRVHNGPNASDIRPSKADENIMTVRHGSISSSASRC
jgi:hypothetical protein